MFDIDERLRELSAKGDALERLSELADFEVFRPRTGGASRGRVEGWSPGIRSCADVQSAVAAGDAHIVRRTLRVSDTVNASSADA